jgi:hypothetical protein
LSSSLPRNTDARPPPLEKKNDENPATASLKKMMPSQCTVVRDGAEERVDAAELVPGDLVRLSIGDRIPAGEFFFFFS